MDRKKPRPRSTNTRRKRPRRRDDKHNKYVISFSGKRTPAHGRVFSLQKNPAAVGGIVFACYNGFQERCAWASFPSVRIQPRSPESIRLIEPGKTVDACQNHRNLRPLRHYYADAGVNIDPATREAAHKYFGAKDVYAWCASVNRGCAGCFLWAEVHRSGAGFSADGVGTSCA